jgi:glycosyl transferase family WbsX
MREAAAEPDSLIAQEYRKLLQRSERGFRDPQYKPERTALDFDPARSSVKLIAYYLPQFHLIPENEEAWGRGFTEWMNVTRALPQFAEHYQPHLPGDLGFYDLSNEDVLERQTALARKYGIFGFCIHYYWFRGQRLLEKPLSALYRRKDLDIRFCLCWANETWSRRWDGSEDDVLIPQIHTPETDKRFIEDAVRYMDDPRYVTIDGRLVLVVYRSELLPDPERTIEHWRNVALKAVGKDLFLLRAMTFKPTTLAKGFDASVEFPPHRLNASDTSTSKTLFNPSFSGQIFDYPGLLPTVKRQFREYDFPVIPTAIPGWDNTPRRGSAGACYHGSTPAHYAAWLAEAAYFAQRKPVGGSSYVFINSWNEWGEGAHLEPDQRFGHAYLRATLEVLRPYCADASTPAPLPIATIPAAGSAEKCDTALVVHASCPDRLHAVLDGMDHLNEQGLFISISEGTERELMPAIARLAPRANIFIFADKGRALRPFLYILERIIDHGYRYLVKLPARADEEGPRREDVLPLLALCRPPAMRELFAKHPRLGLLAPAGQVRSSTRDMGSSGNRAWLERLCHDLKLGALPREFSFVGNGMYAGRVDALERLTQVNRLGHGSRRNWTRRTAPWPTRSTASSESCLRTSNWRWHRSGCSMAGSSCIRTKRRGRARHDAARRSDEVAGANVHPRRRRAPDGHLGRGPGGQPAGRGHCKQSGGRHPGRQRPRLLGIAHDLRTP